MGYTNIVGNETGDTSEYPATSGTLSVQNSTFRTGNYALRTNPTTTAVGFARVSTLATTGAAATTNLLAIYARVFFRYATKPASNDEPIAVTGLNAAPSVDRNLEVRINSSGNLVVYDSALNLLATGSTTLSSGTWYEIKIKDDVSDAISCVWEVKINGVSEVSGSYANANGATRHLILGKSVNRNGNTVDFFYDDVAVRDDAYPGTAQLDVMQPNGAGNYQTATRGGADSGSNFGQVDEIPHNSDTDYLVTDNTVDHAETEALESAASAGVSGTINCVKALVIVKRDGASNGLLTLRTRSGSTDSDTTGNFSPTGAYVLFAKLLETDPDTGLAWTTSGLDALEVGIVEKSSVNKSRMTMCCAMVDYTPAAAPTGPPAGGMSLLGVGR